MCILSKRIILALAAGMAITESLALAGTALAAGPGGFGRGGNFQRPAVVGTVASLPDSNGMFTVTAKQWQRGSTTSDNTSTTATYTITTTSDTTVTKAGAASSVSAIAVGDMVMVQGTVTGTNTVAATSIRDGIMDRPKGTPGQTNTTLHSASAVVGNGEPVIGGIATVNSDGTLTVTTKSGVAYTVTVPSSATISKKT